MIPLRLAAIIPKNSAEHQPFHNEQIQSATDIPRNRSHTTEGHNTNPAIL